MAEASPTISEQIRAKALEMGFDDVGFASAMGDPAQRDDLTQFVAEGRHGEMAWMAERIVQRSAPDALWPQAKSVIVLGVNYGPAGDPLALLDHPKRGNISVYARNKDYHDVVKKRLKALARWMVESFGGELKVFVDTAPVMEKPVAARAGLGWQGRHTNLVSRRFGSWLFLSEIFTTLDLPPDPPGKPSCGSCTACLPACPTGAIGDDGTIDARECLSYLTIEHKGAIPLRFREAMGNRIYGCDDCLAVCPWTKFAQPTRHDDFRPRAELAAPRLTDLVDLDDASFRQIFAGSPIKRIGRDRMVRNVLIAIGNSGGNSGGNPGDAGMLDKVVARLADDSPLVRGMAVWALRKLDPPQWQARRPSGLKNEIDEQVRWEWCP